MRDYGIVSPKFWIGETGKRLRDDRDAQVLAAYLMTSPHSTMTGVYLLPLLYVAHETGIPLEGVSKALRRLIQEAFCEYDFPTETVFVLHMAAWQIGETLEATDKRVIGVRKEVERMTSSLLRQRFIEVYDAPFHLNFAKPLGSPFQAPSKPGSGSGSGSGARSGSRTGPGTEARKRAFDPAAVRGLNLKAWHRWVEYRSERKPAIRECSLQAAAEELASFGAEQLAVVKKSIAHGYQGLFDTKSLNGSGKDHKTKFAKVLEELHRG